MRVEPYWRRAQRGGGVSSGGTGMDLTGYHHRSSGRLGGLVQPDTRQYDPKHKPGRRRPLSPGARALLALSLLALAWMVASRTVRWLRRPAHPAAGDSHPKDSADARVAGAVAAKAQRHQLARAATATLSAGHAEKLMQQRIERSMRLAPSYRGPGKIETFPQFGNANRVLLATHNRLMWYRYDTDELRVIHEGQVGGCWLPLLYWEAGLLPHADGSMGQVHAGPCMLAPACWLLHAGP